MVTLRYVVRIRFKYKILKSEVGKKKGQTRFCVFLQHVLLYKLGRAPLFTCVPVRELAYPSE